MRRSFTTEDSLGAARSSGDHDLLRSDIIATEKTKHKLTVSKDINFVSEGSSHSVL